MNRDEFIARLLLAGYSRVDRTAVIHNRFEKDNTMVACYIGFDRADIYTRPKPTALWSREWPDQPMAVAAIQLGII